MLIEYTFPTSLDGPAALMAEAELLIPIGFIAAPQTATDPARQHFEIELLRGVSKWRRPADVRLWAHSVKIEWDAGQVKVGASMPPERAGSTAQLDHLTQRQADVIKQMLQGYAEISESMLSGKVSPADAKQSLAVAEQQIANEARNFKRQHAGRLAVILLIVVVSIAAIGTWIARTL